MLRRVRPMIRYGGAVCIALGLAPGPARAEAGTTAPQIELVVSAVADEDASGAAYVELRPLHSGSASETMTLPAHLAAEMKINGGTGTRSEDVTYEVQEVMRISHAAVCMEKKTHPS